MRTILTDVHADLIRHGKHARAPAAQPAAPTVSVEPPQSSGAASASASSSRRHREHREREQQQQRAAEEQANQAELRAQSQVTQPQQAQTPHKDIAEFIVKEEREAKNKLPVYPGLEDFELLEKMGE